MKFPKEALLKIHGFLWVDLEIRYEGLGYNNFFKHLDLSVSRPPSLEILEPSLFLTKLAYILTSRDIKLYFRAVFVLHTLCILELSLSFMVSSKATKISNRK